MKSINLTNTTAMDISVLYRSHLGHPVFMDIPAYTLNGTFNYDERDEESLFNSLEFYGKKLVTSKLSDEKAQSINEEEEAKRLEASMKIFDREVETIEKTFAANDSSGESTLVVSEPISKSTNKPKKEEKPKRNTKKK